MRRLSLTFAPLALVSTLALLGACGTAAETDPSMTGAATQPIIGGSFDTTRQAVVMLQSSVGLCSGTIFKVDTAKKVGWIVTAAHCVDPAPEIVIQANDVADEGGRRTYEVIDSHASPDYDPNAYTHDVAIVRFYGASSKTPVIPIVTAAPDGLTVGKTVTSVGYGRTTPSNQAPDDNTRRKNINRTVSGLTTGRVTYSLAGGGICSGDSGGPVLYNNGSGERIVAIHSNVTGECLGEGNSMRLTNEFAFLNTELARALPSLTTCDACTKISDSGDEVCANKVRSCLGDSACKGFYDCIVKCGGATAKCQTSCRASNGGGAAMFNAFLNCNCVDACQTSCASTCKSAPKCGYKFGSACDTCLNGACCAEEKNAAADRVGYVCLADGGGERCADSDAYIAFSTCQRTNCAEACGVEPMPEPGTSSGEPGASSSSSSGAAAKPGDASETTSGGCSIAGPGNATSPSRLTLLALAAVVSAGAARLRRRSRA